MRGQNGIKIGVNIGERTQKRTDMLFLSLFILYERVLSVCELISVVQVEVDAKESPEKAN
jgi:hypothetical protein